MLQKVRAGFGCESIGHDRSEKSKTLWTEESRGLYGGLRVSFILYTDVNDTPGKDVRSEGADAVLKNRLHGDPTPKDDSLPDPGILGFPITILVPAPSFSASATLILYALEARHCIRRS